MQIALNQSPEPDSPGKLGEAVNRARDLISQSRAPFAPFAERGMTKFRERDPGER
jgi:hypothetical protein